MLILNIKETNITIIDINIYYAIYKLKKAKVFIIFIKDLKYSSKKSLAKNQSKKYYIRRILWFSKYIF